MSKNECIELLFENKKKWAMPAISHNWVYRVPCISHAIRPIPHMAGDAIVRAGPGIRSHSHLRRTSGSCLRILNTSNGCFRRCENPPITNTFSGVKQCFTVPGFDSLLKKTS